ncbi:MAG: hypothetical protein HY905_06805 [Deltaproteobacteria bacterium]|nr:hypothetical protein [Deltaproteobacteria bacterium]
MRHVVRSLVCFATAALASGCWWYPAQPVARPVDRPVAVRTAAPVAQGQPVAVVQTYKPDTAPGTGGTGGGDDSYGSTGGYGYVATGDYGYVAGGDPGDDGSDPYVASSSGRSGPTIDLRMALVAAWYLGASLGDVQDLVQGDCGFIDNGDLQDFCRGDCGFIDNGDVQDLCRGDCGFIDDGDLQDFCRGDCGFIDNGDLQDFCRGDCGFIDDSFLSNACRAL